MPTQKQIWNAIAPEWFEFKTNPGKGVEEFLKNKKGKILDLGSGAGRHLLKTKGKLYLVDFSDKMIKLAKKRAKQKNINAEFFVADASKLPFEDNYFDSAISIAVIHCITTKSKREKAIKELYRVLKPKAQAIVAVWNINSKRFKNAPKEKYVGWRDKGKRYYYLYDEKEIHDLFKKVGFKIKKKIESEVNVYFQVEK
jgi:ubiquinone/menaquinone biosynthesis C-methylase UbiE